MKSRVQYQTLKVSSRCNGISVASSITFDFLPEIQSLVVIYYNNPRHFNLSAIE